MEILVLVFQIVLELLAEIVFEVLLELGLSATHAVSRHEQRSPSWATIGYLVLGAALGGLSFWCLPERVFPLSPLPGLSLVLSPLCAGIALELWGRYRRSRGHVTSSLATWYGGAALAWGVALVRFVLLER